MTARLCNKIAKDISSRADGLLTTSLLKSHFSTIAQ
ncbi:hypothetical protein STM14_2222 [Salmonella enterica subsp. enterica serovar Typhimurium str. 14028S]|uniref:Uncharacterized protein n=2 Tax=Salmonella enterica I TaxID=59201 RepID=A0A0F6B2E7_SALT1|nr:hypothetical protein SPAB_01375 [Salmonella enterica subsp. enterica serovar Paratyphi B str. SPB7]ACY88685.1 hypothetical protein STM14_2222 [Salmonella enterica subsp. enterica serovar Typhimurium str. 14028S]